MDKIDLKEFVRVMNITYITALRWINEGKLKAERKKIGFNRFKYLVDKTEVDRIKELRN